MYFSYNIYLFVYWLVIFIINLYIHYVHIVICLLGGPVLLVLIKKYDVIVSKNLWGYLVILLFSGVGGHAAIVTGNLWNESEHKKKFQNISKFRVLFVLWTAYTGRLIIFTEYRLYTFGVFLFRVWFKLCLMEFSYYAFQHQSSPSCIWRHGL